MEINLLAVLVSAIISMAIGAVWYSKGLFGKAWAQGVGLSLDQMTGNKGGMAVQFVALLILIRALAEMVKGFNPINTQGVIQVILLAWLGFIATTMISQVLWEKRPFKFYLINTLHYLAVILVSTFVIFYWR